GRTEGINSPSQLFLPQQQHRPTAQPPVILPSKFTPAQDPLGQPQGGWGAQNPAQQPQGGRVAPSKSGFDDDFILIAIGGVVFFFTILILAIVLHNTFLWWLIVGWITGFLASRVMRGGGYGLVGDTVVG